MFGNVREIDIITLANWKEGGVKKVRLIDVRSINEYRNGIIPEGEPIPLHTLPLKMDELCQETPTVLYCHSGARSAQACAYLAQQGYNNVYNLQGGIVRWVQHGMPIVAPDDRAA